MTAEHSWHRGRRRAWPSAAAAVVAVVVMLAAALGPVGAALAQTAGAGVTTACSPAGQPCFAADQQQELAKVGDDVMARRVPADSPVGAAIRQFVDYWVAYSVALGYTFAFSYLPG